MHTDKEYQVEEVGLLQLKRVEADELEAGSVGYVIAGVKAVSEINVGDTITEFDRPAAEPLPGYKEAKPVVFSSIYPISTRRLRGPRQGARQAEAQRRRPHLPEGRLARPRLRLPLRLPRPAPSGDRAGAAGARAQPVAPALRPLRAVRGGAHQRHETDQSTTPSLFPDPGSIKLIREPFIKASIMIPERYLGAVMELCRERRGENIAFEYLAVGRLQVTSELPLAEILFDFYDRLKTDHPRLRLVRLRHHRLPRDRPRQGGHPGQRRQGGRPLAARPPREGPPARPPLLRAAGRDHPPAELQDRHPGRHRRQRHRPLDDQRLPQGRHRQVLRRRHLAASASCWRSRRKARSG